MKKYAHLTGLILFLLNFTNLFAQVSPQIINVDGRQTQSTRWTLENNR